MEPANTSSLPMHLEQAWPRGWPIGEIQHQRWHLCEDNQMEDLRPEMSRDQGGRRWAYHPAEDWLPSGKYLLSSLPYLTTDDGFDSIAWRHRSWLRLVRLPRSNMISRLSEELHSMVQLPPAISTTFLLELLDLEILKFYSTFEHSNSSFTKLRKTLNLVRLLESVGNKGVGPYCQRF